MVQDGLKIAQQCPKRATRWGKWGQAGPRLLQMCFNTVPESPKMFQRGLKMVPAWPKMVKDVCLRLSLVFILGLLGRSMALPSFCLRFAFALLSLCLRFAFALPSFCFRCAFELPLLCLCFCFPLLCLCLSNGGVPEAIRPLTALQKSAGRVIVQCCSYCCSAHNAASKKAIVGNTPNTIGASNFYSK